MYALQTLNPQLFFQWFFWSHLNLWGTVRTCASPENHWENFVSPLYFCTVLDSMLFSLNVSAHTASTATKTAGTRHCQSQGHLARLGIQHLVLITVLAVAIKAAQHMNVLPQRHHSTTSTGQRGGEWWQPRVVLQTESIYHRHCESTSTQATQHIDQGPVVCVTPMTLITPGSSTMPRPWWWHGCQAIPMKVGEVKHFDLVQHCAICQLPSKDYHRTANPHSTTTTARRRHCRKPSPFSNFRIKSFNDIQHLPCHDQSATHDQFLLCHRTGSTSACRWHGRQAGPIVRHGVVAFAGGEGGTLVLLSSENVDLATQTGSTAKASGCWHRRQHFPFSPCRNVALDGCCGVAAGLAPAEIDLR